MRRLVVVGMSLLVLGLIWMTRISPGASYVTDLLPAFLQGAYDTDTLIGALEGLRRFLGGQKATLVWDGLPAHRSLAMRAGLRRQRSWLVVESNGSGAPTTWPTRSCATVACPYGEQRPCHRNWRTSPPCCVWRTTAGPAPASPAVAIRL